MMTSVLVGYNSGEASKMVEIAAEHVKSVQSVVLRVPGWERFPWLRAGFSTRQGGRSQVYGPDEWNLGWTVEDDPAVVAANREEFCRAITGDASLPLVTVRQVHGTVVRDLMQETEPFMAADGKARMEGDGMVSLAPGQLLAALTADCVPVLLADTRTRAVGAVHAGWRGTLGGIIGHAVALMVERYGSRPGEMVAAVGPCIQACCFEVGQEVRSAFVDSNAATESLFRTREDGSLTLDLDGANRRQLLASGLEEANITSMGQCTACAHTPAGGRLFFSHRAEKGRTGRMLSGIARLA